jgi:hypothetical protein
MFEVGDRHLVIIESATPQSFKKKQLELLQKYENINRSMDSDGAQKGTANYGNGQQQ